MFLTNYDVTRVERKTAEYAVISSFVKKPAQNREKSTNGDYYSSYERSISGSVPVETGIKMV